MLEGILGGLKLFALDCVCCVLLSSLMLVLWWRSCLMLCELLMLAFGFRLPVRFKMAG